MRALTLPGFSKGDVVALSCSISDEGVLSIAVGVTTSSLLLTVAPVESSARALSSVEANLLESVYWVELLWVCLELWLGEGFDFLSENSVLATFRWVDLP